MPAPLAIAAAPAVANLSLEAAALIGAALFGNQMQDNVGDVPNIQDAIMNAVQFPGGGQIESPQEQVQDFGLMQQPMQQQGNLQDAIMSNPADLIGQLIGMFNPQPTEAELNRLPGDDLPRDVAKQDQVVRSEGGELEDLESIRKEKKVLEDRFDPATGLNEEDSIRFQEIIKKERVLSGQVGKILEFDINFQTSFRKQTAELDTITKLKRVVTRELNSGNDKLSVETTEVKEDGSKILKQNRISDKESFQKLLKDIDKRLFKGEK